MHTDKEEEALINEEAILNIVENSQNFHHLSQRLSQTTVFSEYNWNVFSSGLFLLFQSSLCSLTLLVVKGSILSHRICQANRNFTSATTKTSYFLIMSPVQCVCRSYCALLVK